MMSRRETFMWFLAAAAIGAEPRTTSAATADLIPSLLNSSVAPWPSLGLVPVSAAGYGTDPDTQNPSVPWPLTLEPNELESVTVLGNLILPGEGTVGGAGDLGIASFLNEWVSAPYPDQQLDRIKFIGLLEWFDAQSIVLQSSSFFNATRQTQMSILDLLMVRPVTSDLELPVSAFDRFRMVLVFGYYSIPAVLEEIGISQNTPIMGAYPGPSDEAIGHLNRLLVSLGLNVSSLR